MKILWISYLTSWTKHLVEQVAKLNSVEVIIPFTENEDVSGNGGGNLSLRKFVYKRSFSTDDINFV